MTSAPTRLHNALSGADLTLLNDRETDDGYEIRLYRLVRRDDGLFVGHPAFHQYLVTGQGWNRKAAIADCFRQFDVPLAARLALAEMTVGLLTRLL